MRSAPTTLYQGRHHVARRSPAADSWGVFVRSRLAALDNMTQAEFRRAMELAGLDISKQTASQWANGENAPDANTALIAAAALNARDVDALRAAGYGPVADRMEKRDANRGGEPVEPVDPVIKEIMAASHLSLKVRQALVGQYLDDREEAAKRARKLARVWAQNGDSDTAA